VPHDFRSVCRTLLLLTDVLAGLVAAAFLVVFYVRPELVGAYDESSRQVGVLVRGNTALELVVIVALLLLGLNAMSLIYGRRPKVPQRYIQSHSAGGIVRVSRDAVEAGLRAVGEGLDVVSRLRVSVETVGNKKIVVRAPFQAPEGIAILDAGRQLRSALAERFREMVHVSDAMKIDYQIEFVGFSGKRASKPQPEPEAVDEPPSFTGPQYPIGDDDALPEESDGR